MLSTLPTDNTVASNTEIINNICLPEKVPVIAGEEGICEGCGVATLSISYYDLGVATGKMALESSGGRRRYFQNAYRVCATVHKRIQSGNL